MVVLHLMVLNHTVLRASCIWGTATKRSITQRLRHKTWLLQNVAAHNVAVTKRKSYKTYTSNNTYYCDVLTFFTFTFWNSYVLELLCLETLTFSDVTLSDITVV